MRVTRCNSAALCDGLEFSQVRDLPALRLGATDLDAILLETHSLIDAPNGPEDLGQEMVKVNIDGQDIEIPHLSLASSLAFPNQVFGFSYMYNQGGKPISSVTIAAVAILLVSPANLAAVAACLWQAYA